VVDAQIFTNDRKKLPAALGHDVSKQTAQAFQISTEPTITPQQEISTGRQQEQQVSESAFKTPPAPDRGSVARAQTLSRPTKGRRYRGAPLAEFAEPAQ